MKGDLRVTPEFEAFCRLAQKGNIVPVWSEVLADTLTPVSAFMKFSSHRAAFLLESVEGNEKWATYSFLGFDPQVIFSCKGSQVVIQRGKKVQRFKVEGNPLSELQKLLAAFQPVNVPGVPRFFGGAVGYVGYDCVRYFEKIPDKNPEVFECPEALFFLSDSLVVFNNLRHQIQIIVNAVIPRNASARSLRGVYDKAVRKIAAIKKELGGGAGGKSAAKPKKSGAKTKIEMRVAKEKFLEMVKKAKGYIERGDIIQVVLSNAFEGETTVEPFQIYRALRRINPSPYMYFFRHHDFAIVGSSPETLVRLEGGEVTLRPIAGTRRRGASEGEDLRLENELLADPKERAEHVMLVDLGRNDLGRVAQLGTVAVQELMKVERYSHVMHLTSSIKCWLSPAKNAFDLLAATFPAGTLSGAPKIRAMEIIDELENYRRGPYGGALGYISYSGNMDFCITIRTLLLKGKKVLLQAGAGIVADSVPESEFTECVNKAKAVLRALEEAEEIE